MMYSLWYTSEQGSLLIAFFFAFLSFTDFIDGFYARRYNQVSKIGALLDPLADKVLMISAALPLLVLEMIPVWYCALIIIREICVMGMREIALEYNFFVSVAWAGKCKAALQNMFFVWGIACGFCSPIAVCLLYSSAFFTVYSGVLYAQYFFKQLKHKGIV